MNFQQSIEQGTIKKVFKDILRSQNLFSASSKTLITALKTNFEPNAFQSIVRELYEALRQYCEALGYLHGYKFGTARHFVLILKQAKELPLNVQFISLRSAQDPIIIKQAGDAAEGFVYSYTFDSTSKQAEQFIQKFQKKYGREPDAYAAEGYEAYKLIVAAFNECDKNTGCIKEFFKKPQQTVFGEVTFDAKGDPIYAFHMKTIRNGTFVKLE